MAVFQVKNDFIYYVFCFIFQPISQVSSRGHRLSFLVQHGTKGSIRVNQPKFMLRTPVLLQKTWFCPQETEVSTFSSLGAIVLG